jgi:hypothetical protein
MKRVIVMMVALLMLALTLTALANEPQPEPGSRADNECNPGGTMAGKCTNDWEWKGGWYIARFNEGLLKREEVPTEYQFLLPPPVEVLPGSVSGPVAPQPTSVCLHSTNGDERDILLALPVVLYGATYYESMDGTCSGGEYLSSTVVIATNEAAAYAACAALNLGLTYSFPLTYFGYPVNYWRCGT